MTGILVHVDSMFLLSEPALPFVDHLQFKTKLEMMRTMNLTVVTVKSLMTLSPSPNVLMMRTNRPLLMLLRVKVT